ncbi:MAG: 50S ribosomal protein L24 [Patescibacteria group bacterium]
MHIKKGDNVIVITGDSKGKKGKVLRMLPKEGKVIVEGINVRKKTRKSRTKGEASQIIELAMPIHASNVRKG